MAFTLSLSLLFVHVGLRSFLPYWSQHCQAKVSSESRNIYAPAQLEPVPMLCTAPGCMFVAVYADTAEASPTFCEDHGLRRQVLVPPAFHQPSPLATVSFKTFAQYHFFKCAVSISFFSPPPFKKRMKFKCKTWNSASPNLMNQAHRHRTRKYWNLCSICF